MPFESLLKCLACLLDRQHGVHENAQAARIDHAADFLELRAIGLDDEELTFNSLRLCFLGGRRLNDTYERPSLAQNTVRSRKRVHANCVEDNIHIRYFDGRAYRTYRA